MSKTTTKKDQTTDLPEEATLASVNHLIAEAKVNPEALKTLREKYGLAVTVDGELVKVKKSVVAEELREAVEDGTEAGSKLADAARTAGFWTARAVLDAPVKGAGTLREKLRESRIRRDAEAERRARIREAEKAAEEKAKAEAKAQAAAEAAEEAKKAASQA